MEHAWFTRSPQAPSLPSGSDLPSQRCGRAGLWVGLAQTLASVMPAQVSSPGLARDPGDSKRVPAQGGWAAGGKRGPTVRLGNLCFVDLGAKSGPSAI